MLWCSYCHTVCEVGLKCPFCDQLLVAIEQEDTDGKGEWQVFCSDGPRTTVAQEEQILGRNDPYTASFFLYNGFVSGQHARLTPRASGILVMDMESANGTFLAEEEATATPWRRLRPYEEVALKSGSWLLLSHECLCRVWLKWVPRLISLERMRLWRKGVREIPLSSDNTTLAPGAEIVWRNGFHWLVCSRDFKDASLNGRMVATVLLKDGHRVVLGEESYQYVSGRLIPSLPLIPPTIHLSEVSIAGRLHIENLTLAAGQFIGIVGESGAGKTTLIEILTGWLTCQGSLRIAGEEQGLNDLKKATAYVPQYDLVQGDLKVQNSLLYSALLKGRWELSWEEKITTLLQLVGLASHGQQRVRTLSGGQRKRVNLAQELLEEVSFMVLDEPTSGLDLDNHYKIMKLLHDLCRQGRTVICVTHHLSHLELFDHVVILSGGKIKCQGLPAEIASAYQIPLQDQWRNLYEAREQEPPEIPCSAGFKKPLLLPDWSPQPWILLVRRFEEFFHPEKPWRHLLSLLLAIPLIIGLLIYIAWPVANGDEKRFFLCAVAAFWLAMSLSSQEFTGIRYRMLLHEMRAGVRGGSYLIACAVFYSLISLAQSAILIAPSLTLMEFPNISLFAGMVWAMGISGALVGLNLSLMETPLGIPVSVSVPLCTIVQLLFSEMVMGLVLEGLDYFDVQLRDLRDFCYLGTFSRYMDMAYRACHNSLEGIPDAFYYNVIVFISMAWLFPIAVMWTLLMWIRMRKTPSPK